MEDKILFITILMGSLFVQCMSAPAVGLKRTTRTSDENSFWWQQPCGRSKENNEHVARIRHHRSDEQKEADKMKQKRTVLLSFRKFQSQYKNVTDGIYNFYTLQLKCENLKNHFEWIPKVPKLNTRKLQKLEANETEALLRFINDTQKFAILIYQLNKTKVKTESNIDENPRFDIFVGIVKQTRQVLCESETLLELVSNNTDLIQKLPPDLEKEKIWGNSTDTNLTKMCIRDRPVLSAFNTFMKKWKKILRTAFRLKESSEDE